MNHPRFWLLTAAFIVSGAQAEGIRVLNSDAHFPEGPIWYHDKLYYVEYDRNTVTTWDGSKNAVFWSEKGCGPSAVVPTARGELVTTCYDNGTIGHMSAEGKPLPPYAHDKAGNAFLGPNDFAPDGHGGLYFTCSGTPGPIINGKVFYMAADGAIAQQAVDLHSANGLAVSKDGRILYVVETEDHRLVEFDIAADRSLSNRRLFLNLDDMTNNVVHIYPDGVKIDSKGQIYIGQNPRDVHAPLAGIIFVVDTSGHLLRKLALPSPGVPNLAFSPDEKTVFVTALDQLDKSPYHGKIYSIPNR
ncbi:MAG TPA: SMP-30/gluconolactonase/LRE family protein [Steroidobacteraceae bacterium]|nr:SMP-30/gluconolactonase/LRE family protein [Steroidobacteraceae bacterium]